MAAVFTVLVVCTAIFSPLTTALDTGKVELALYYESLCPDCQEFILKQLFPTFNKVSDIMNLTLVPYGNAMERRISQEWRFECQHGPAECVGNVIETCAIYTLKNISVYFPFIHCCEEHFSIKKDPHTVATTCAKELGVDYTPIEKCATSSVGNKLEHEMALKTDALEPKHQYVPWVTLFGKHTDRIQKEAESNLLKLVCDNYKGTKPEGCQGIVRSEGRCYKHIEF